MVLLSQRAGVKMVHVPYRGRSTMNDALAGHVDLAIGSAAPCKSAAAAARALAQTSAARIPRTFQP